MGVCLYKTFIISKEVKNKAKNMHTNNVPSRLRVLAVTDKAKKYGSRTLCICIKKR